VTLSARLAPLLLVGAIASAFFRLDAQTVVVRDPGPGPVGRRLAEALAAPHRLIAPGPSATLLPRDSAYAQTVIVLHRDAIIEARVHGDVIVVGGDAFLHPGAIVDGRVVAIGGAVYESRLAITRAGVESHRDFTFDVQPTGQGYALDYQPTRITRSQPFTLPGIYGIRIPTYDRIDGLSLAVGPMFTLDTGRFTIDPTITYRSNLGVFDPAVMGDFAFGRRTSINVYVGRTTLTNDDWIWSELVNSAAVLGLGLDTRNYYRADRAEATVHQLFEGITAELEPFIGVRFERDRSAARDSFALHVPWSFFGRSAADRMRRPNPAITRGTLQSILLGAYATWEAQRVRASLALTNEGAAFDVGSRRFVQSTLDGMIRFPTFASQEFYFTTHVIATFGDTAPPQRWSYLGGSGTLPTLDLLSMGGDHLVYFESNYFIPFLRFDLPVVGPPSITLRHMIGSAGVGGFPDFEQNLALRVALSFLRVDFTVDPARREWEVGAGLSLAR
jgi:hypothetical protein